MLSLKILVWICSRLPYWLVFPVFGMGSRLFFLFGYRKRFTAYKNIKIAFPELDFNAVRRLARASFIQFGYSIAETFRLPVLSAQYLRKYIVVENPVLLASKEPAVMVGMHEGSWEMLNAALASLFPYAILAQEQKGKGFNEYLNRLRARQGLSVIATSNLRELISYFKKGFWTGFAVDQGPEENAAYVKFLNRTVPVPSGAVRFAKKFNRDIICGYIHRERGPYHLLRLKKIAPAGTRDTAEILQEINNIYEYFIRQSPADYLWFYKRFKYASRRDVLILDDGRPGHLNQSRGLYRMLVKARPEYQFQERTVPVRFKNNFCRSLAQGCAFFSSGFCAGCGACLRHLLTRESFGGIAGGNADVVISAGSYTAAVNVIAARLHQAVPLSVFQGNIPAHKFHTVFSPVHDRLRGRNVVPFNGAIVLKDRETLAREGALFAQEFGIAPGQGVYTIGILVGGGTRRHRQDEPRLKAFLKEIDRFAAAHGSTVRLLVSTSRRTPKALEEFLEQLWGRRSYVASLVIANKKNFPWVTGGMLAFADAIVVSSDSISMVAESASFKDTLVLDVVPASIQRNFSQTLAAQNYVLFSGTQGDIYPLLTFLKDGTISLKRIDNASRIIEYFKKHLSL